MNRESPAAMSDWIAALGIPDESEHWSVAFAISTVPIERWFYARNKLAPDAIKLDLVVPKVGLWRATLSRRDESFQAQWRPNGDLRVESAQLKYRKLVAWPALASLREFPSLPGQIEKALGVSFLRHVDVGGNPMLDTKRLMAACGPRIREWLSPCADTIGTHLLAPTDGGR